MPGTAASVAPSGSVARAVAAVAGTRDAPLFVGFSGGLDSTVLLHAATVARRAAGLSLPVALHVNHDLHPDAAAWARHCVAAATRLGVHCVVHRVAVLRQGSIEAAARAARYAVFRDVLDTADARLWLAHHRDDQAETLLLRLCQGRGLYGMPQERPLGKGMLIRPLLECPRADLLHYASARSLAWLDDPMNEDLALDRNYLRQVTLPALRERFPRIEEALLVAGRQQRDAAAQLVAAADLSLSATVVPLAPLLGLPASAQRIWVQQWLRAHGLPLPERRSLDAFLGQVATAAPDRQPRLSLTAGALCRYRGALHLVAPVPALPAAMPVTLPGVTVLPHGTLVLRPDPDGFVAATPLWVGFRRGGESLRVGGFRRDLKTLFQGAGVPPWQRASYPLLFDADGLVALPGIARRDVAEAAPASQRFRASWYPTAAAAVSA